MKANVLCVFFIFLFYAQSSRMVISGKMEVDQVSLVPSLDSVLSCLLLEKDAFTENVHGLIKISFLFTLLCVFDPQK